MARNIFQNQIGYFFFFPPLGIKKQQIRVLMKVTTDKEAVPSTNKIVYGAVDR